jgi:hypothetical protein
VNVAFSVWFTISLEILRTVDVTLLTSKGRWRMQRIAATAVEAVLIAISVSPPVVAQVDVGNGAATAKVSVSDVFLFGTQSPVVPATSTLTRSTRAVSATVHTSQLIPEHVYTLEIHLIVLQTPPHPISFALRGRRIK